MQNYTILAGNETFNLTVNVVADNLTATIVPSPPTWLDIFSHPMFALLFGAILTYSLTSLRDNRKEKKEIRRYEDTLITDILDISSQSGSIDEMAKFYNAEIRNPFFTKTEDYNVIREFMINTIKGDNPDEGELIEIQSQLKT